MIKSNLKLVNKVWNSTTKKVDVATRAARDEMMTSLIQLTKEFLTDQGKRPKVNGKYTKAVPGHPPMMRSAKLRNSIRGEKYRLGFASYAAVVGPTIIYGRKVELGGPNWKPGVKFPYMEPSYNIYRTQVHKQIIDKYFRRFR